MFPTAIEPGLATTDAMLEVVIDSLEDALEPRARSVKSLLCKQDILLYEAGN